MSGVVVVPRDVNRRAENLIVAAASGSVLKGVELLLKENTATAGSEAKLGPNDVDSSLLLKRGLDLLQSRPFELLGVEVGCGTVDIRKAYKKLALKYHPDKSPKTTPLFQLVQAISTKLSSAEDRAKEAVIAAQKPANVRPNVPPTNMNRPPPDTRAAPPKPTQFPTNNPAPSAGSAPNSGRQPQDDLKRKNYYEELLKEQYRKAAEAERRAKEYAAKYQNANFANNNTNANNNEWQGGRKPPTAGAEARNNTNSTNPTNNPTASSNANQQQGYNNAYNNYYSNFNKASEPSQKPAPPSSSSSSSSNTSNTNYPRYQYPNAEPSKPPEPTQPTSKSTFNNNQQVPQQGSQAGNGAKPSAGMQSDASTKERRILVPRPFGLQLVAKSSSMVELEWKTSQSHSIKLAVELSWKDHSSPYKIWEMSAKLIRTGCCRKKNLTPNTKYEFRVRAVEELPNGVFGNRSEWTEALVVQLPAGTETPSASSSYANLPKVDPTTKPTTSNATKPTPAPAAAAAPASTASNNNSNTTAKATSNNAPSKPMVPKPPNVASSNTTNSTATSNANTKTTDDLDKDKEKPLKFRRFNSKLQVPTEEESEEAPSEIFTAREKPTVPMHSSADQRAKSFDHTESANSAANVAASVLKGLSKQANKDKTLSASSRFAWGKDPSSTEEPSTKNTTNNANPSSKTETTTNGKKKVVTEDFEIEEEIEEESVQTARGASEKKHTHSNKPPKENEYVNDFEISDEDEEEHEMETSSKSVASAVHPLRGKASAKTNDIPAAKAPRKRVESPVPIEVESEGSESEESADEAPVGPMNGDDSFEIDGEMVYSLFPPPEEHVPSTTISPSKSKLNLVDSNGKVIYRHPVHAEPFPRSEIQGHLFPDRPVIVCANCGDWLKVKIHNPIQKFKKTPSKKVLKLGKSRVNVTAEVESGEIWGWCLRRDKRHVFLRPSVTATPQKSANRRNSTASTGSANKTPSTPAGNTPSTATPGTRDSSEFRTPLQSNTKKTLSKFQTPTTGNGLGSTFSLTQSLRKIPLPSSNHKDKPPPGGNASGQRQSAKPSVVYESGEEDGGSKVEEWIECYDDQGNTYYFNEQTNESKWEPPEWFEETDPTTKVKYYVHVQIKNNQMDFSSTWTKPAKFARLKR